jgi:hypothetical protein
MRAVKQFFDWCDNRRLRLAEIDTLTVGAYIEQLGTPFQTWSRQPIYRQSCSRARRTPIWPRGKSEKISRAMDKINHRFGRDSIHIGMTPSQGRSFSGSNIAFTCIPDIDEFLE